MRHQNYALLNEKKERESQEQLLNLHLNSSSNIRAHKKKMPEATFIRINQMKKVMKTLPVLQTERERDLLFIIIAVILLVKK